MSRDSLGFVKGCGRFDLVWVKRVDLGFVLLGLGLEFVEAGV